MSEKEGSEAVSSSWRLFSVSLGLSSVHMSPIMLTVAHSEGGDRSKHWCHRFRHGHKLANEKEMDWIGWSFGSRLR